MSRLLRASAVAAAVVTLIGTAATGAGPAALAAGGTARPAAVLHWRLAFRHQFGSRGSCCHFSGFTAVAAPARNDAWAFGWAGSPERATAAVARWNGQRWRAVTLHAGGAGQIVAASAVSRDDIWAAGGLDQDVLHWNGHAWSVARHWAGGGAELTGITAISASDVWAFGGPGFTRGLGTWHYDGHGWKRFTGNAALIETGSAVSARDIWAISDTAQGPGNIIVRYNGSRWLRESAPALRNMDFTGIAAVSRSSVWAVGSTTDGDRGFLVHWNGGSWRRISVPDAMVAYRLAPAGHGGLWLAASASASYLLYRSASGAWSRKRLGPAPGSDVAGLAAIPGTGEVWGGAAIVTSSSATAALYRGSRS